MPIDPILVSFGHFAIRWYSLIIMAAIVIGLQVVLKEAKRKGFDPERIYEKFPWLLVGGLVGARLFHVIDHWQDTFSAQPWRTLNIWEGGLAIWGAIAGGLITLAVVAWRRGWSLAFLLDLMAPAVVLGQGIGRLACLITGDTVGVPTSGPIGIAYSSPHALAPQLGVYYTPVPLFEFLMNLSIFAILWRLRKKQMPEGALFFIYLSLYSAGRIVVANWSLYKTFALGLNQAQFLSLVALLVSIPALFHLFKQQKDGLQSHSAAQE